MKWPPLPRRLKGAGGPITVRLVKRVRVEGESCWGSWEPSTRTVRLEKGAPIEHQWRTLHHEWMHAVLHDSGIQELLSEEGQEALCQAIACARIAEMRR